MQPLTIPYLNRSHAEHLSCLNSVGPDYADDTSGWLFEKGGVAGPVKLIKGLCNNPEVAWSRRKSARSRSLIFSWERTVEQLARVYEVLAVGGSPGEVLTPGRQGIAREELLVSE